MLTQRSRYAEVQQKRYPGQINALFKGLKKAMFERALGAELTHHLGCVNAINAAADDDEKGLRLREAGARL